MAQPKHALGLMYLHGLGTLKDLKKAAYWVKKHMKEEIKMLKELGISMNYGNINNVTKSLKCVFCLTHAVFKKAYTLSVYEMT